MKRKVISIFFYFVFVFNKLFLRSVRKIVYNKNIVKHKLIPIFFYFVFCIYIFMKIM